MKDANDLPVVAKRLWNIVRVMFYMLRKGISKKKLMVDLNMMMKRGKIAGKAIHNLIFQHQNHHSHFFACAHAPPTVEDAVDVAAANAVNGAASPELMWWSPVGWSEAASPALPGFGRSPVVRQLRITDSPFPVHDVDEDSHVDEAAERFIEKFYNQLKKQNTMALC